MYNKDNHFQQNRNYQEIKTFGRMNWQRAKNHGRSNTSEIAIQPYKKIVRCALHSRDYVRQKIESIIGCGVLHKMTGLGIPVSYRCNAIL